MNYLGKPIAEYFTTDLEEILASLREAEDKRNEASKHPKFNVDRQVGNKLVKKQDFPPPNPNFLILKSAIEEEIRKRKNA